ncbi:hypothetical protein VTK73DRAFT_2502 [Phialemonium thermophilum]|uniref:Cytochrome P450 n=1 Tax=Phialemonium thermophilum TaxID=223376 RepID=A0ABR3Y215_9PEZI
MDRPAAYRFLAALTLPAIAWSLFELYEVVSSQNTPPSSLLLPSVYVFLTVRLLLYLRGKASFHAKERSLGCGPVPSYPHRDPIFGLDLFLATLHVMREDTVLDTLMSRFRRLGSTYSCITLGQRLLLTDDPANVKAVLLGPSSDDWPIAGPRLFAALPVLGPRSIFATNGPAWKEARSALRPSFARTQLADPRRCFGRHVGRLLEHLDAGESGHDVELQRLLLDMTMDSSTDFLFGRSTNMLTNPSPEAKRFLEDFEYASRESTRRARLGGLLIRLPHKKLDEATQRLRDFVQSYLRKALADMEARKEKKEIEVKQGNGQSEVDNINERDYLFLDELVKSGVSEDYMVDQVLSTIVAGRDTTAMALTAVFWFLARSPDVVDKLRKEILAAGVEDPSWEQLKDMRYLNNVLKEALRLCPPVATNSRVANRDLVLPHGGGPDGQLPVLVPKGTPVRWSLHSLQRRNDIYGPDANEFRPERWDDDLRVGWEYIPFHGGPRICLGQQFALTQMAYTVYRVFRHFKSIKPRDNEPLKLSIGITISFSRGCWVSFELA